MASPDDRKYLDSHEWHKLEDGIVVIGITQFAVDELTDVTFVDFQETEGEIKAGTAFGEIESVKTNSDLNCGIDGEIVAINDAIEDNPALVNESPWEDGWLIKVKPSDPAQLDGLMSAADYDASIAQ